VKKVFPNVLLQWEDFLKDNAIFQLERFRDELLTFNDDIQGTASVVVAGIFGALRLTGGKVSDHRLVFAGAGASAHGIAELFVSALVEEGVPVEEARKRIWTCDTKGLAVSDRPGLEGSRRSSRATAPSSPPGRSPTRVASRSRRRSRTRSRRSSSESRRPRGRSRSRW
jgi:NAD-dependent malic enzyme (EC 1.1.1.38)